MKQRQQFVIRVNFISILPSKPSFNMNATYTWNRSIDVFAINIISMNPFLQSISNPLISIRIRTVRPGLLCEQYNLNMPGVESVTLADPNNRHYWKLVAITHIYSDHRKPCSSLFKLKWIVIKLWIYLSIQLLSILIIPMNYFLWVSSFFLND